MNKPAPTHHAAKWMLEGIREHEAFDRTFRAARAHAMNAAFFFLSAREGLPNGAWGEFLIGYKTKISERKVQFYIQLATEAIAWVQAVQPELTDIKKIQAAAREVVMQSPKPLIALCRELGHMRKFGEYDSVKYAAGKRISNGAQIEFEFDYEKCCASFEMLSHIDEPNFHFKCPEGKTETEALAELETRLENILAKIKTQRADALTIEA
ncbi:MAG: hypothetical protein H7Y43_08030 [Akkermansiaceae bacterium]|nr:hypothetical protein [Verrucomicrobiales bacterium]